MSYTNSSGWDEPTVLPGLNEPGDFSYYALDIDDNERIIGMAAQVVTEGDYQRLGVFTPILWEPDGSGGWNAPVRVSDLLSALPDNGLSLDVDLGGFLFNNLGASNPDFGAIALDIMLADNLAGTRISDDGNSILTMGDLPDTRTPEMVEGTYVYPPDPEAPGIEYTDQLTIEFGNPMDVVNWYYQDPMRLHFANESRLMRVSISGMAGTFMVQEEPGVFTDYPGVKADGDDPDTIVGTWTVTDASSPMVYTMVFSDTGTVSVTAETTAVPLRKMVSVVLHEDAGACCEDDDSGALDIMQACQNMDNIISVPIQIQNAPDQVNAVGFDVVIDWDDESIEFVGFEPGKLIETWWNDESGEPMYHYDANQIADDRVRVGAYNEENPIPKHEDGIFGYLLFHTNVTQCVNFTLENLVDDVSGWSTSGGCTGNTSGSNGDINGDDQITPQDALCAFQRAVNDDDNTYCGLVSEGECDVTMDCACTAADPLCILNAYLLVTEDPCALRLIEGMAVD